MRGSRSGRPNAPSCSTWATSRRRPVSAASRRIAAASRSSSGRTKPPGSASRPRNGWVSRSTSSTCSRPARTVSSTTSTVTPKGGNCPGSYAARKAASVCSAPLTACRPPRPPPAAPGRPCVVAGATPAHRSSRTRTSSPAARASRAVARTQWSVAMPQTSSAVTPRSASQAGQRHAVHGALERGVRRRVLALAHDAGEQLLGQRRLQRGCPRCPPRSAAARWSRSRGRPRSGRRGRRASRCWPRPGRSRPARRRPGGRPRGRPRTGERAALAEVLLDVDDQQRPHASSRAAVQAAGAGVEPAGVVRQGGERGGAGRARAGHVVVRRQRRLQGRRPPGGPAGAASAPRRRLRPRPEGCARPTCGRPTSTCRRCSWRPGAARRRARPTRRWRPACRRTRRSGRRTPVTSEVPTPYRSTGQCASAAMRVLVEVAGDDDPGAGGAELVEQGPGAGRLDRRVAAVQPDRAELRCRPPRRRCGCPARCRRCPPGRWCRRPARRPARRPPRARWGAPARTRARWCRRWGRRAAGRPRGCWWPRSPRRTRPAPPRPPPARGVRRPPISSSGRVPAASTMRAAADATALSALSTDSTSVSMQQRVAERALDGEHRRAGRVRRALGVRGDGDVGDPAGEPVAGLRADDVAQRGDVVAAGSAARAAAGPGGPGRRRRRSGGPREAAGEDLEHGPPAGAGRRRGRRRAWSARTGR